MQQYMIEGCLVSLGYVVPVNSVLFVLWDNVPTLVHSRLSATIWFTRVRQLRIHMSGNDLICATEACSAMPPSYLFWYIKSLL